MPAPASWSAHPKGEIDFYSEAGGKKVSVEHMGSVGLRADPAEFSNSIYKHALKSTDELVVDVTGMPTKNYSQFDAALARARTYLTTAGRSLPEITWIGRK